MPDISAIVVRISISVNGFDVPLWRVRLLQRFARLLRVPLQVNVP